MRLLHISDWHLGRTTYNASRAEDHDTTLGEILEYAREHRPDLIIHTGDLFDGVRPAYTDMARGVSALQELGTVSPVVVLCGNHDSPALFDLLGQLVGPESRLHFVSRARLPERGGVLHFTTADDESIRLAPLPFVHANRMLDGFEDPTAWMAMYADRIHLVEESLARGLLEGFDNRRDIAIFAAHLHVGGAVLSGSERRVHVGDSYASHLEHIPAVTYAAFGHIHKPQNLPGTVNGTYAGSPIPLDFGEVGEEKRVVLVEARPGTPPEITSLALSGGRPLWRFAGTLEDLAKVAPEVGVALALMTVHVPTVTPDLQARVRELLPEAVLLQVHEVAADRRLNAVVETGPAGEEPSVTELFRSYLAEQGTHGTAADRVLSTFDKLLEAVEAEQLPTFPQEALLPATKPVDSSADHAALATATKVNERPATTIQPTAGMRVAECQTCGSAFETPIRRGRPPRECPGCRSA